MLDTLKPIYALIFLFKYVGQSEGGESSGVEVDPLESGVWFANQASPHRHLLLDGDKGVGSANFGQVINNSCGTLAALNAVSSTSLLILR